MQIFEVPFCYYTKQTTGTEWFQVAHTPLDADQVFILDLYVRNCPNNRCLLEAGRLLGKLPGAANRWKNIQFVPYIGESPVTELDMDGLITCVYEDITVPVVKMGKRGHVMVNKALCVDLRLFRQYLLFYTGYWDCALLGV